MAPVIAALVGVASPSAFNYRNKRYAFDTAAGVEGDLNWYEKLIRSSVPAERLTLVRLSTPAQTASRTLRERLLDLTGHMDSDGLFVLVLCGHGFQAPDDNGDEPDGLDEVFAAADGPIVDDFFGALWQRLTSSDVVVIADTCSADTIGIRGGRVIEPVISLDAARPRRLSISASMEWQKAGEVRTRHGVRGVLSLALEDAWTQQENRTSYLAWFRAAAELVSARRPQQNPRLRYLGPDQDLLTRTPFSLATTT